MVVVICTHNHHAYAPLPLWFVRKVAINTILSLISWVAVFGYVASIFLACASSDDITSPGIVGGIFICLGILFLKRLPAHNLQAHAQPSSLLTVRFAKSQDSRQKRRRLQENMHNTLYHNQTNDEYHKSHTHIHTQDHLPAPIAPIATRCWSGLKRDDDHGGDSSSDNNQPYDYPPSRSVARRHGGLRGASAPTAVRRKTAPATSVRPTRHTAITSRISQGRKARRARPKLNSAMPKITNTAPASMATTRHVAGPRRAALMRVTNSRVPANTAVKADYYYGLYQEYKDRARSC